MGMNKEKFFGENVYVKKKVVVGKDKIHAGDTVEQQPLPSKTLFSLIQTIGKYGDLFPYKSPLSPAVIPVGTELDAVYCPHDD